MVSALSLAACGGSPSSLPPPARSPAATPAESSSAAGTGSIPTNPTESAVASTLVPTVPAVRAVPAASPLGQSLPLNLPTYAATQVITVVATSASATVATLQAWDKAPGGAWTARGPSITAHLGSAGLSAHPSESVSATPLGSFSLTRAFGADANPGSGLPYHQTTPADWWISQPGALYNTMQTCESSCPFTQGDPNEHLYYETPFYNYAVVINYNTAPVVAGAGSAFFLHVTDGTPTAGCVSIPQTNLLTIMKWLSGSAQPRILIGLR